MFVDIYEIARLTIGNNLSFKIIKMWCVYLFKYFPNCFCNQYWNSVIQNAIGCGIGSFAAIFISWIIYKDSLKKGNSEKVKVKNEEESNQLKAFAIMLDDSIKMIIKQSKSIKALIEKLKEGPVEFPLITVYPIGGIKRIIDTITVEKTGLAYVKHFPSENSLNEFIKILSIMDYLYSEFSGLPLFIERATINHHNRKIEFSNIFEKCNMLVIDFLLDEPKKNHRRDKVWEIKNHFDNNRGEPSNLSSAYLLFILPLNDLMIAFLNEGFKDDFNKNLVLLTSKARDNYSDINAGYAKVESEIDLIQEEVNTQIQKLKILSSTILLSKYAVDKNLEPTDV